jgi:uncharacterized GH25 family protein
MIARLVGLMITRLLGLLLVSSSASAHDFWVQPATYHAEPGISVPITLQVGHGPARQRSQLPLRRITRIEAVGPDGTGIDLRDALNLGAATQDGVLTFPTAGTYAVVLETDNRARTLDGAESYSRHSKALVQVGPAGTAQATQPLGMTLEIVPDVNPYSAAGALPIHVLFEGKPVAGAVVELTNLENDAAPVAAHLTDEHGRASFAVPPDGQWLLNVVWKKLRADNEEALFESYFSSLSFGR